MEARKEPDGSARGVQLISDAVRVDHDDVDDRSCTLRVILRRQMRQTRVFSLHAKR